MSESWCGLITDFESNLLSFSAPTLTLDFDNPSNGYGHSKTALVRSVSGSPEIRFVDRFQNLDSISESTRIMIFKIAILLSHLGSLMICTHDLFILTKTKENNILLWITRIRWQNALNTRF
jgi:hypothetical protein